MNKQPYLVVYDYGQGGVWAYVVAESAEQIEQKFPELKVVLEAPEWMTPERETRIRQNRTVDIDQRAEGFLADILAERDS